VRPFEGGRQGARQPDRRRLGILGPRSMRRQSLPDGGAVTPDTTEIAPATYRVSTFHPDFGIQFNQFLVVDEEPFLMLTGMRRMF
jgi:hypothetical protein